MMVVNLECMYCGHKWGMSAHSKAHIEAAKCTICNDTNLIVRDASAGKYDYYVGCPEFNQEGDDYDDTTGYD